MINIINHSLKELKKVGRIFHPASLPYFCIAIAILLAGNAKASDSNYSQLTRNVTLESAALNKGLFQANMNKKSVTESTAELTDKKITEKSRELEGVFLSTMLEPIFPEGKESSLYGGGGGNAIFRTLMIQEYGKILANAGGVGLTKGIEKQLRQKQ